MFTSLLAVPLAITFFNPFPSFKPFPFPAISPSPIASALPSSNPTPSQSSSPTPAPSISTAVEIEEVEPSSANFFEEFKIKGLNFGSQTGSVSFRYYNQSFVSGGAPIISWTNNEIRAKVPAVKKGSYRIRVITSEGKKSDEARFNVKNGQPIINSTSINSTNGQYEFIFQGTEFGYSRGEINIYADNNVIAKGIIKSWTSSRVRFELPSLPSQEYGFQIQTADGRPSSLKYFTVGN